MAYVVEKVEVWTRSIDDTPGTLAAVFAPLAEAGVNLEFVLARPHSSGETLVFMAPIKGAAHIRAARAAGLTKTDAFHALRVIGADAPGLGLQLTQPLADAGVNMRAFNAMSIGGVSAVYISFWNKEDADKARVVLRKAVKQL